MPKAPQRISNWHGGKNTLSDPKDIETSESTSITNFDVTSIGQLKVLGGWSASTGVDTLTDSMSVSNGHSVFSWNSDRIWSTGTADSTGEQWLVISNISSGNTHMHASTQQSGAEGWNVSSYFSEGIHTLANTYAGGPTPSFFAVDGALRIMDTTMNAAIGVSSANSSSLWFGYIYRGFMGQTASFTSNCWWSLPQQILPPSLDTFANSDTWVLASDVNSTPVTLTNGSGKFSVSIDVDREKGDGTVFMDGRVFYVSYTFDNSQESLPVLIGDSLADCGFQYTDLPIAPGDPTATTVGVTAYGDGDMELNAAPESLGFSGEAGTITVNSWNGTEDSIQTLQYGATNGNKLTGIVGWVDSGICSVNATTAITPALCTEDGGAWTYPSVNAASVVTFETPGGPEERDNELGFQIRLYAAPEGPNANPNAAMLPAEFGGNRVTHVNFYTNKFRANSGFAVAELEDFAYCGSFDLKTGWRLGSSPIYNDWEDYDGNTNKQWVCSGEYIGTTGRLGQNYMSRTGVFPDTQSLDAKFKHSVVVNRRTYAADVRIKDVKGDEQHFPDRMIKSLPNGFDSFPTGDFIDAAVDDGDSITALVDYGGKILQFKERHLYIVNVNEAQEYLEGVHQFKGVKHSYQAKKTSMGIAWFNKYGAYMYDGAVIKEISLKRLDPGTFSDMDTHVLAYNPIEEQLHFIGQDSHDSLVYNLASDSWVDLSGEWRMGSTDGVSNQYSVSDSVVYNGLPTIARLTACTSSDNVSFFSWESNSCAIANIANCTNNVKWESKNFDFSMPSSDTKIYKVYVNYMTSPDAVNSNMEMKVAYNDGETIATTTLEQRYTGVTNFPNTGGQWKKIELRPPAGTRIKCLDAYLVLENESGLAADPGFKINDIDIIHRNKRTK